MIVNVAGVYSPAMSYRGSFSRLQGEGGKGAANVDGETVPPRCEINPTYTGDVLPSHRNQTLTWSDKAMATGGKSRLEVWY